MGNGGDGRQAAERPPGEGGVRLRVRDRLGFLIYITHIGLGLLHLGWALLVSGGCGCTRGWKSGSAPAWNCGCGCGCTRGLNLKPAPASTGSKIRGYPHPRVQLPSLVAGAAGSHGRPSTDLSSTVYFILLGLNWSNKLVYS